MSIKFACIKCNRQYCVKDGFSGKTTTCLNVDCKAKMVIPFPAIEAKVVEKPEEKGFPKNGFFRQHHKYVCPCCAVEISVKDKSLGEIKECPGCHHKTFLPKIDKNESGEECHKIWNEWQDKNLCKKCNNPVKERFECCHNVNNPNFAVGWVKKHPAISLSLVAASAAICGAIYLLCPGHVSTITTACYCFSAVSGSIFVVYKVVSGQA